MKVTYFGFNLKLIILYYFLSFFQNPLKVMKYSLQISIRGRFHNFQNENPLLNRIHYQMNLNSLYQD